MNPEKSFKELLVGLLNSFCGIGEGRVSRGSFSLNEFEDVLVDERIRILIHCISYILSNAFRYAPSPDRDFHVDATVSITPQKITVLIRDNGIGIDMEKHGNCYGKVREVYWKKGEKQRGIIGRGIGLYQIAQKLQSLSQDLANDETFCIDSILGEGTSFRLAMSTAKQQ